MRETVFEIEETFRSETAQERAKNLQEALDAYLRAALGAKKTEDPNPGDAPG